MDRLKDYVNTLRLWISKNRRALSVTLAFVFIALIIYYIYFNWHDFRELNIVRPYQLIFLGCFSVLNLYATGRIMDVVLRPHGLKLHPIESYGLAALSRLTNQVTPGQAGLILRAAYLKKKYQLSGTNFLSALAGTHVFMYLSSSALGLLSVWILQLQGISIPSGFVLVLLGVLVALTSLIIMPTRMATSDKPFIKHVTSIVNGWQKIKEDRRVLLLSFWWSTVLLMSVVGMIYFSFNSLGATINIATALFLTSIVMAGGVISITPAGIGVYESLVLVGASGAGLDPSMSLAAALLQRLVNTIVLYTTTPLMSHWLFGSSLLQTIKKFRSQSEKA